MLWHTDNADHYRFSGLKVSQGSKSVCICQPHSIRKASFFLPANAEAKQWPQILSQSFYNKRLGLRSSKLPSDLLEQATLKLSPSARMTWMEEKKSSRDCLSSAHSG